MFADQLDARLAGRNPGLRAPQRLLRLIARLKRPRPVAYDPREIAAVKRQHAITQAEVAFLSRRGIM